MRISASKTMPALMRTFWFTGALMLVTTMAMAQAAAGQQAPPPAQPPAAPAAPPAAATPPEPFPEGAKMAYINVARVAAESADGKVSTGKVQELNKKKVAELNEKNKTLQAAEQKLAQSATVMSDVARDQLEREVERQKRDIQRFTQDAQTEVQDLQQELQEEFQRRLFPIIQEIAETRDLHMIVSPEAPIIWAHPGLDITTEVIKKLDAAKPAAPKPPAK